MKYIKKFENHSDYEASQGEMILPNVSLCESDGGLYYNPRFFCKLTLYDNIVIDLEGKGFVTRAMIRKYSSSLTKVELGELCTGIGYMAFLDCFSLKTVIIPDSVTFIGESAFRGDPNIMNLDIPKSVRFIEGALNTVPSFYLSKLDLSEIVQDGVVYLNDIALATVNSGVDLTSCTLREGTVALSDGLFLESSMLESLVIPDSVVCIGDNVFNPDCPWYTEFISNSENEQDGIIYLNDIALCEKTTGVEREYVLRDGTKSIAPSAFRYSSLTGITLPDSIEFIGAGAFSDCTNLTSIKIPSKVTELNKELFDDCFNLREVEILGSSVYVGPRVFSHSGITAVPKNITNLDRDSLYGCSDLAQIEVGDGVLSLGESFFDGHNDIDVSIVIGKDVRYIDEEGFSESSGRVSNIKVDPKNLLFDSRNNCNGLIDTSSNSLIASSQSLTIPKSIKSISQLRTLSYISSDFTIPENIEYVDANSIDTYDNEWYVNYRDDPNNVQDNIVYIGKTAFDCVLKPDIETCTIKEGTTYLGGYLFMECDKLSSVVIPSTVTDIGERAFFDCSNLTNIVLPESITRIGAGAFSGCGITTISLPENITEICPQTFYGSQLSSITLPNKVAVLAIDCFAFCSNLTEIFIPASVKYIDFTAFRSCSNLSTITVDPGNTKYDSRENCNAIIETETNTLVVPGNNLTTIPESINKIGSYSFHENENLTSISIPDSVTEIESNAFGYCKNLQSIVFGNSLQYIYESAFYYCRSLNSIVSHSMVAPKLLGFSVFDSISENGTLTIPTGATGYNQWLTMLPSGWTIVEQ